MFSSDHRTPRPLLCCVIVLSSSVFSFGADDSKGVFRAGAAAVDVTPVKFPVIVNGYFNERQVDRAQDRSMSRALVLDDGRTRLAVVVVDNLMIPRELLDRAKAMAAEETGIPTERMLISATHSHTTASAMGCLGARADADYVEFLPGRIAKSIVAAAENLQPARIGWNVVQDHAHNHCRRWIFRPDRMASDPFGDRNVRAHMHPGHKSVNHVGPSGPADPDLSLLAVQSLDGKPLAVLANYAMHYYGATPVSSDFCGRFGDALGKLIGAEDSEHTFVGAMSQGTSGDSMWMDYSGPAPKRDLDAYTNEVAAVAAVAYRAIDFREWVPLAMAERKLKLRRRVPSADRLAWARSMLAEVKDRLPASRPEIYANEQILLHGEPEVELKLQAIRIGELGITALPDEVYGITGLKLKAQSPLTPTFNIELANGAQGYIPPPEQHALGGYTTWPARTAGLEVQAEPKIVAVLLELLEAVSEKPRRQPAAETSAYASAVLASKPIRYWSMSEMAGTQAIDAVGGHAGAYEPGVAFFLPGPSGKGLPAGLRGNRCAHFAGGRVKASADELGETYSVELWLWNGLPSDVRPVTGYFFSRGTHGEKEAAGDHLGIGGTHDAAHTGKLMFFNGNTADQTLGGRTQIAPKTWNHVALVREGERVTVYLNGDASPEFVGEAAVTLPENVKSLFLGGRNDGFAPLEGKLDEIAVFDRALSADEVVGHYRAAGR